MACELGAELIALLLINRTSDQFLISNKNIQKKTLPIHSACLCPHSEQVTVVQAILTRLNSSTDTLNQMLTSVDDSARNVLACSVASNHLKIVEILLSITGVFQQPDADGNLPVHYAAKSGTPEMFRLLLEHNLVSFESNSARDTPLHIATEFNRFHFINLILYEEKCFMAKKSEQYVPMIRRANRSDQTALQIGLIKCHEKCVEELSNSEDVDLNVKDANNLSIYHLCVCHSNLESLRYLLNKKSDKFLDPLFIRFVYKLINFQFLIGKCHFKFQESF